jgi:hypothetical protein
MSDAGSLTDSAYEMIHGTDSESQDDRLTESTCSLSASRPDDVHSLDGSEAHYNSDSDEESAHSSHAASSIRYADQALQNPSTQLPTTSLEYGSSTEGSGVVVRSIEFQETDCDDPVLFDKISAKHAIREFNEDESSAIAHDLGLPDAPKRLVASIRQTMSPSYLSTQHPLRVLYVGRAEAQRSIVLKICSAIWASPKNGSHDQDHLSRHREGVYNIVPISSFGPAPELDLMEASHYQIKVEHCTSAEEIVHDADTLPGDTVYSITIEQESSYRSSCSPGGLVVQPKWELPHIAVFYCSERDDAEAEWTRNAAWSFMKRHGVPSIFIADHQSFRSPHLGEYIDEHTVHLCLESRDPKKPMAPQRFPIDFASFTDIDSRQMNRNLAFLTGLSETEDTDSEQGELGLEARAASDRPQRAFTMSTERQEMERLLRAAVPSLRTLMLLITSFFLVALAGWLQLDAPILGLHSSSSTGVCSSPPTYPKGFTTSKASSVVTSTKTVLINVTSTQTVQVSQTKPSTSTLASALSLAGFLSDGPSAVPADTEPKKPISSSKKTVCAVQVYSPTELLVAIPNRNKAVWLAHGAIDIAVRRSDAPIKTKISSVDEGVLVELGPKDAYGMLNVSVVTTRRPKINETFQVDFGKTVVAEAFEAGMHMLQDALKNVAWSEDTTKLVEDARKLSQEVLSAFEHVSDAVRSHTGDTVKRAKDNVREELARQIKSAETARKEVDLAVLQAQIASRLWWLKMQGRLEDYAEYERNASRLLKIKHDELVSSREGKEKIPPKEARSFCGFRSGMYRPWKKNSVRRDEHTEDSTPGDGGAWDSRWKKLMGGM